MTQQVTIIKEFKFSVFEIINFKNKQTEIVGEGCPKRGRRVKRAYGVSNRWALPSTAAVGNNKLGSHYAIFSFFAR